MVFWACQELLELVVLSWWPSLENGCPLFPFWAMGTERKQFTQEQGGFNWVWIRTTQVREGRRLGRGPEVLALTTSSKKRAAFAGGGGYPGTGRTYVKGDSEVLG